ncbi:Cytochrome P450 monooxygenase mpaDE [Fusarium oxysporum f. sp. albedinis]|nr:Cytochrome P450 monooxygenase mpaDE [Fusarium oxysporum f. sp. albedinis]
MKKQGYLCLLIWGEIMSNSSDLAPRPIPHFNCSQGDLTNQLGCSLLSTMSARAKRKECSNSSVQKGKLLDRHARASAAFDTWGCWLGIPCADKAQRGGVT